MNLPKDPIVVANRNAKRESLLRAARVNPDMSAMQLAARVGCNRVTAVEWLKEAGLNRAPTKREAQAMTSAPKTRRATT